MDALHFQENKKYLMSKYAINAFVAQVQIGNIIGVSPRLPYAEDKSNNS